MTAVNSKTTQLLFPRAKYLQQKILWKHGMLNWQFFPRGAKIQILSGIFVLPEENRPGVPCVGGSLAYTCATAGKGSGNRRTAVKGRAIV